MIHTYYNYIIYQPKSTTYVHNSINPKQNGYLATPQLIPDLFGFIKVFIIRYIF